MIGPYLELVIIAIILGAIVWLSRRNGAANPVGTGKLLHEMSGIRQEHVAHGRRLKKLEQAAASAEDVEKLSEQFKEQQTRVEAIERQVSGIERQVSDIASTGKGTAARVREMDKRQDTMAEYLAALRADVAAQRRQLDLIYQVLVPKGMQG
ncbi:hypothetical protein AAJ72_08975 [Citromicrobium sp. RCC1885]|uniref:hypothetical protein n=1 Tax=unclassified Citromicrobium TaxID=2630544 RepID=UPI0006C92CA5|nr:MULTISPECIES: hypothetical protein [unclassified Citromicrobium]KPM20378.1 hypothetical protein VO57_15760 [Citromicrobium sp. JL2201]KPM23044.1 hypothetical protein AAJ72_08975 [Citromicrobium sp. RCC1885]KPM27186.1 hypothetical protein AAJ74_09715 [Citromicrobium sp. RCC1878]OAM09042.1 hypothetical protein A0U43_10585 [Citromicrobium sp. RCC1897]|tara:strand:+ start:11387 stop:11842 length:456 start_codon:yes stop_codon:yes gene_type:complete